jgi:hypothetical protein
VSSDIDLAVRQCKELESTLRSKHGADGEGLHQLVTSVESRLPPELVRILRRVATIRNKIVHEEDYRRLDDKKGFVADCAEAKKQLNALARRKGPRKRARLPLVLVVLIAIASIVVVVVVAGMRGWINWF